MMEFALLTISPRVVLNAWTINPSNLSSDKIDLIRRVTISLWCAVETDVNMLNGEFVVIGGTLLWIGISFVDPQSDADVARWRIAMSRNIVERHIIRYLGEWRES